MQAIRKIMIFAAFMIAPGALPGAPLEFNTLFVNAAKRVKPSVVNIVIYRSSEKGGERVFTKTGFGSGTIVSKDGYVVTNYHVVKKGNYYQAVLSDGTECEMALLPNNKYYYADSKTDIAVMRIENIDNYAFTPVMLGNSDFLEEGEWVVAIGNPYGLRQSVTTGIVSSKGRNDIGFADIEDFIQTDVPINPGNSGGPLVNLKGEMVGMNTAIRTISGGFQGISFAIPSNVVRQACVELINYGRIRRGWIGFLARERKAYRMGEKTIVEVISVIKDSPAEMAGICKGDIVREIGGKKVNSLSEMIAVVGNTPVSTNLTMRVSRDGYLYEYVLVLREKDAVEDTEADNRALYSVYGIELNENSQTGDVVVSYLSPMGIGYQNGLKKGDIVRSLDGSGISSIDDFMKVFNRNRSKLSRLGIQRDTRLYTIEMVGEADSYGSGQ